MGGTSTSKQLTTEFFQWNHRFIELPILIHDDLLVTAIADDNAGISPGEIVHAPKRVDRQEETVYRISAADVNTKQNDAHDVLTR